MKSKKVTMLVAVLAVAVVALAGVGYAATNYVGTTQNSGNNMDVTYVKVSQGGDAAYTATSEKQFIKSTFYDTETTNAGTKYTVTGLDADKVTALSTETKTVYKITTDGKLKLIVSDTDGTSSTKTYTFKITADKSEFLFGTDDSKVEYYFGLDNGTTTKWSAKGVVPSTTTTGVAIEWTFADPVGVGEYNVVMAAAGSITVPTNATGAPADVTGVTFTFEASAAIA